MSEDRRESLRRELDYKCWADVGSDRPPTECRLANVSASGARLTCDAPDQFPDEFVLFLTRDGKVGRRCQVVRREASELGVRFVKGNLSTPKWLTDSGETKPDAP